MAEIIRLNTALSNSYLIRDTGTILVDTGGPKGLPKLLSEMERYDVRPRNLNMILLTHAHYDHAANAAVLKTHTNAPVAVHADDVAQLREGHNGKIRVRFYSGYFYRPSVLAYDGLSPDMVLEDGYSLEPFGVPATVIHTPGHTYGSVSIIVEGGGAIGGDLIGGGYGIGVGRLFPGWPHRPFIAVEPALLKPSIEKVLSHEPELIYLGHGGPVKPERVRRVFGL